MSIPQENPKRTIVLVFWRPSAAGTEFFVPLHSDYMSAMQHEVTETAAAGGRTSACKRFNLNPRANARVFYIASACYVVFELNRSEVAQITHLGGWMTAPMASPALSIALRDIANRL